MKNGRTSRQLFGGVDSPKFVSSITYFEKISRKIGTVFLYFFSLFLLKFFFPYYLGDNELNELCVEVLALLKVEEEARKEKDKIKEAKIAEEIAMIKRKREEKLLEEEQKRKEEESSLKKKKEENAEKEEDTETEENSDDKWNEDENRT